MIHPTKNLSTTHLSEDGKRGFPRRGMDLRQSPAWGKYLRTLGWEVVQLESGVQAFVKKLPLIGSIIKIQRPAHIPFDKIDQLAHQKRALFVKIEPLAEEAGLAEHKFRKDNWPLLPPKTLLIDLTPKLETIQRNLSKDARQAIRKARQTGLEVQIVNLESTEFTQLFEESYKLLRSVGRARKFWTPPLANLLNKFQSFGEDAWLATVTRKGQVLSCAVILVYDSTAFYHHAAASSEGRHHHAAYLLLWETIKRARAAGLK
ncbi:GNAT family N-acetyltransferase, partial [Candidatus Parcubacteria bacterium]|nr:GNAT family N-acetyltransferase [Candidatus Parcubacteria bacterium]